AALKLLPMDPAVATKWVLDSAELIDAVVCQALDTDSIRDLPAASAPWMEQWSQDHGTRTRRLFIA
ncbi:MAG: Urease accessory protein UreF-like protein, partial [Renibacterium salmoninarum]|nr:Urease accessory protein UreF-like protein [Renibacterium salmoninarum]